MKAKRFTRRTDHWGVEGGRGRREDEGPVSAARDLRGDLLQLEGEVRRDDGVGGAPAEGARTGERQAEAAAGRGGARQGGAEGSARPKMVSPQAKRVAVTVLMTERDFGVTRACGLVRNLAVAVPLSQPAAGQRAVACTHRGDRRGEAPIRLSAGVSAAAAGRLGGQPQARLSPLSRGRLGRTAPQAQADRPVRAQAVAEADGTRT